MGKSFQFSVFGFQILAMAWIFAGAVAQARPYVIWTDLEKDEDFKITAVDAGDHYSATVTWKVSKGPSVSMRLYSYPESVDIKTHTIGSGNSLNFTRLAKPTKDRSELIVDFKIYKEWANSSYILISDGVRKQIVAPLSCLPKLAKSKN